MSSDAPINESQGQDVPRGLGIVRSASSVRRPTNPLPSDRLLSPYREDEYGNEYSESPPVKLVPERTCLSWFVRSVLIFFLVMTFASPLAFFFVTPYVLEYVVQESTLDIKRQEMTPVGPTTIQAKCMIEMTTMPSPVLAIMLETPVDMYMGDKKFGESMLPRMTTSPDGMMSMTYEGVIQITDLPAYLEFGDQVFSSKHTSIRMKANLRMLILGFIFQVPFDKTVPMKGMDGLKDMQILEVKPRWQIKANSETPVSSKLRINNPSLFSLDMGGMEFGIWFKSELITRVNVPRFKVETGVAVYEMNGVMLPNAANPANKELMLNFVVNKKDTEITVRPLSAGMFGNVRYPWVFEMIKDLVVTTKLPPFKDSRMSQHFFSKGLINLLGGQVEKDAQQEVKENEAKGVSVHYKRAGVDQEIKSVAKRLGRRLGRSIPTEISWTMFRCVTALIQVVSFFTMFLLGKCLTNSSMNTSQLRWTQPWWMHAWVTEQYLDGVWGYVLKRGLVLAFGILQYCGRYVMLATSTELLIQRPEEAARVGESTLRGIDRMNIAVSIFMMFGAYALEAHFFYVNKPEPRPLCENLASCTRADFAKGKCHCVNNFEDRETEFKREVEVSMNKGYWAILGHGFLSFICRFKQNIQSLANGLPIVALFVVTHSNRLLKKNSKAIETQFLSWLVFPLILFQIAAITFALVKHYWTPGGYSTWMVWRDGSYFTDIELIVKSFAAVYLIYKHVRQLCLKPGPELITTLPVLLLPLIPLSIAMISGDGCMESSSVVLLTMMFLYLRFINGVIELQTILKMSTVFLLCAVHKSYGSEAFFVGAVLFIVSTMITG